MSSILNSDNIAHRRILVVEDDPVGANEYIAAIIELGGSPLGPISDAGSLAFVLADGVMPHAAVIDVHANDEGLPQMLSLLRNLGIEVIYVCGHDGWCWPCSLDEGPFTSIDAYPTRPAGRTVN